MALDIVLLADRLDAIEAVADWLHQEWFAGEGCSGQEAHHAVLHRLNRRHLPLALVALEDGEPVGTASLAEEHLPGGDGEAAFLVGVYVAPGRRGRGVGSGLCLQALAEARRLRLPSLSVLTPDRRAFYECLGWRHVADSSIPFGSGQMQAAFLRRDVPGSSESPSPVASPAAASPGIPLPAPTVAAAPKPPPEPGPLELLHDAVVREDQ